MTTGPPDYSPPLDFPGSLHILDPMGTSAPDSVKRLVHRFDQNRDATDGSQLAAYSLRPSDSGPLARSRKPMVDLHDQVFEQFLGKVIKLTDGHRAKVEEKPRVREAGGVYLTALH
ncbi:hypothetical protein FJY70_01825 [candidate division WOR-3 bacterium]|nr:hypothetical protein [candidate division WOR-3 bacterium]